MNFPSGPDRGPKPKLCDASRRFEIARVEYTVFTKADCVFTWRIFSDVKLWRSSSDVYGERIEWRGAPWMPGSQLLIDIVKPVSTQVDRVITICTPPRCVAWINHVRGFTMEQWVLFDPFAGGGTKVTTWVEMTGAKMEADGNETREILQTLLEKWFMNFAAMCDELAESIWRASRGKPGSF